MASDSVCNNTDLVAAILAQLDLDPWTFVMCGRVNMVWRKACRLDDSLLLRAARGRPFLNKNVLCGLFGLSHAEADTFPYRFSRAHKTGLYKGADMDAVLASLGGLCGWKARLTERAARQAVYDASATVRTGTGKLIVIGNHICW